MEAVNIGVDYLEYVSLKNRGSYVTALPVVVLIFWAKCMGVLTVRAFDAVDETEVGTGGF